MLEYGTRNRSRPAWILRQPNQHMVLMTTNGGASLVASRHFSNGENMKIEIKRATVCGGVPVSVGDIVEASDTDARVLIALGKAIPAAEKVKKPENREADAKAKRHTRKK